MHTKVISTKIPKTFQRDARAREWEIGSARGQRQFVHCFSHLTIFYQISAMKFICVLLLVGIEKRASIENEEFIFHSNGRTFSVPTAGSIVPRCSPFIVLHRQSTALAIIVIKINVSLLFCFVLLLLMYAKLLIKYEFKRIHRNRLLRAFAAQSVNRIEYTIGHMCGCTSNHHIATATVAVFFFSYICFLAFFALKTVNY